MNYWLLTFEIVRILCIVGALFWLLKRHLDWAFSVEKRLEKLENKVTKRPTSKGTLYPWEAE